MRTSVIKTAVLGLTVASTSLFAEATYSPHKYQQNDWFAEFGGNTAMYVNPAGIAETDQLEFSAAFFSSISGEASQEYVSVTFPMDYKHTLGFSFFENGASIDGGKSYGEYAFLLGYAYRLMHCIALGIDVSVLYINQFDDVKQVTIGADVGMSWNPLASSKYGYLLVGVALQNIAQPGVSMEDKNGFNNAGNNEQPVNPGEQAKSEEAQIDEAQQKLATRKHAEEKIKRLTAEENRQNSLIESVKPWMDLDLPLDTASTERSAVLWGSIPARIELQSVIAAVEEASDEAELFRISGDKTTNYVLIVCIREALPQVQDSLRRFGFTAISFPGEEGTAKEAAAEAENKLDVLARQKEEVKESLIGKTEFRKVMKYLNQALANWVRKKFKRLKRLWVKAKNLLATTANCNRTLFSHWAAGYIPYQISR